MLLDQTRHDPAIRGLQRRSKGSVVVLAEVQSIEFDHDREKDHDQIDSEFAARVKAAVPVRC